ncbi:MAG: hypothetical protein WDZ45_04970, partial [Flavobacteriaceae bacterium]
MGLPVVIPCCSLPILRDANRKSAGYRHRFFYFTAELKSLGFSFLRRIQFGVSKMEIGITCGDPLLLPFANRKSAGYRHRFLYFTAELKSLGFSFLRRIQ